MSRRFQLVTTSDDDPTLPVAATVSEQAQRRALRETLSVSTAALAAVGIGILGLWITSTNSIRDNHRHYLIGLARAAATLVDPVLHNQIRSPQQQNGPAYNEAVVPLRRFRDALPDVHYLYTLVLDGSAVRFVLDAAEPTRRRGDNRPEQSGVWEVYKDPGPATFRAFDSPSRPGIPTATDSPVADAWGSFVTGMAPVRDSSGRQIAAIGVDVDATLYIARLARSNRMALAGLVPAGVVIFFLGIAFYRIRIRGLTDAAAAIENAEAAVRTAESLASERRLLTEVIEATNVGTWEWDGVADTLKVSDRWMSMIGMQRDAAHPMNLRECGAVVHQQDLPIIEEAIGSCDAATRTVFITEFRIKHSAGEWLWVLARGKVVEFDSRRRATRAAGIVLDVSARKAMEAELLDLVQRDQLTGLASRKMFIECLTRAVRRVRSGEQERLAVFFLDFDQFKIVNDTLGHEAGDELLRQIAGRLRNCLRLTDRGGSAFNDNIIGRFGGDEFLVLINDLSRDADPGVLAARLLIALGDVYSIFTSEVRSTASIGMVTSEICTGGPEEILRNADLAMYEAKRRGRACAVLFNEEMHSCLARRMAIETGLRKAIDTSELQLVYQPIVDLNSGRMASAEALVRWSHPTLGDIEPSEFIPIAEESDLIVGLGQWVLREACTAMLKWRDLDPGRAPGTISVNVSRIELALGGELLKSVETTLQTVGLSPEHLQLEVTEREVMRDLPNARALLQKLRAANVKLAMGDFGTGISSLSALRDFPFDTVKINRSFLTNLSTDPDVMAIVHATVNLVENLGMSSLAEGVEDTTQAAVLQSLGCQFAQGGLFSQPVPADRLLQSLESFSFSTRPEPRSHTR